METKRDLTISASKLKAVLSSTAILLAAAFVAGCGGTPIPKETDPTKAVTALKSTLEKWKDGTSIVALQKETPAVYAADEDWEAGMKLVAFELRDVLDQGGFATRIPVRLNIQSPGGLLWKEVEYKVTVGEKAVNIMKQDVPD
jgi:hypothetical protein